MWSFSSLSPLETRQKGQLDKFFESNKGNAGDAESLVRESLQNALDAKSDANKGDPVLVRITIGKQSKSTTEWMFNKFDDHLKVVRKNAKVMYPTEISPEYDYILIEDFNTTGFDGTLSNEDEEHIGSLVRFWWYEGVGEKPKGGGGSHGVGKVTLSEASKSRAFFSYSVREDDDDEILFGYCRLGMHSFGSRMQREYARFGVSEDIEADNLPLRPYSALQGDDHEKKVLEKFRKAFGVERETSGSSILIPNIDSEHINPIAVIDAVLQNFYLPIMKNLLSVVVVDQSTGDEIELNQENFLAFCSKERSADLELQAKVKLASELIEESGFYLTSSEFELSKKSKRVTDETFSESNLLEMRKQYASGVPVKIKINVPLYPSGEGKENGFLNAIVQRRKGDPEEPHFDEVFRGDINISDEKVGGPKANMILDIFGAHDEELPNPLSEFMKYCEDPGHRNWNGAINRRNERQHYKRGETWQKYFVRSSLRDLVMLLEDEEDKEMEGFADDIFVYKSSIEYDVPSKIEDVDGIPGEITTEDVIPPPPPPPKSFPAVSIGQFRNGVSIRSTKILRELDSRLELCEPVEVSFSYEMFGASKAAWRRFAKMEIDLSQSGEFEIESENVNIEEIARNVLAFRPLTKDFSITVTGFDGNRQLYVDVKDKELAKIIGAENDDC